MSCATISDMKKNIDLFWSFRSPFCYVSGPGCLQVMEDFDVHLKLRPVLPAILRAPKTFDKANIPRIKYLLLDWERRAEMLGMPHQWPSPDPVNHDLKTMLLGDDQPYIARLTHLGCEAERRGLGTKFAVAVSHLIFGGTKDWHLGDHLALATEKVGLDLADMDAAIVDDASYIKEVEANQEALAAVGHWGVPTFAHNDEPFFGQDRIDSLRFQLSKDGLARTS